MVVDLMLQTIKIILSAGVALGPCCPTSQVKHLYAVWFGSIPVSSFSVGFAKSCLEGMFEFLTCLKCICRVSLVLLVYCGSYCFRVSLWWYMVHQLFSLYSCSLWLVIHPYEIFMKLRVYCSENVMSGFKTSSFRKIWFHDIKRQRFKNIFLM